jgi:hypothetical protein
MVTIASASSWRHGHQPPGTSVDESSNAAVFTEWQAKAAVRYEALRQVRRSAGPYQTMVREADGWLIIVRPYK